jgi:hypothetical protein
MKTIINITVLIFLLLLNYSSVKADWPVLYTGEFTGSCNAAEAITIDNYGNIYITGVSQTADPGFYYTITTICYYPTGEQKWKSIHPYHYGYAEGVSIMYEPFNQALYVAGHISNETDTSPDVVTIKYNLNTGAELWTRPFDPFPGRNAQAFDIASDIYGNIYVIGQSHGISYNGEPLHEFYLTLVKYNQDGIFQNKALFTRGYNDIGYSLKVSGQYVYASGLSSNGTDDDFITIKYDLNGNEIWNRAYDSGGNDTVHEIAVNPSFGVFVTGGCYFQNELRATTIKYNFTGDQNWINQEYLGSNYSIETFTRPVQGIRGPSINTVDVFTTGFGGIYPNSNFGQTIRYSSDGGIVWRETFNDENPLIFKKMRVDENENVIVTGYDYTSAPLPWLPDHPTIFTLKYNSSGIIQWEPKHINTYATQVPYGLTLDASGNVFLTGLASQYSGILPIYMYWPHEIYYFTTMYPSGDNRGNNLLFLHPRTYSLSQNFPNPFNPVTQIQYSIPEKGYVSLKVFDMLGREIKTLVNEYKDEGIYIETFDGSIISSGVYIYKLQSGVFTEIRKMILLK